MQPYEIRQFRDGSIDYNNYYARPVSLATPQMRRLVKSLTRRRPISMLLGRVTTMAAFVGVAVLVALGGFTH